jgi:ATP-dependent DNA helicase RecG
MGLQPGGEVLQDRARLLAAAAMALALVNRGATAEAAETEGVDFKEEAGRRDASGHVLTGQARSQAVAEQLANEVACLANTPGGGVLIVGVADDGTRVGAASDRDWLRQRIHQRVDVAPAIDEQYLDDKTRILVILVAAAREPVIDVRGRLRWRVGAACAPIDRSQWWADRLARAGGDPLFAATDHTMASLAPGALSAVRRLLRDGDPQRLIGLPERELLTRIGVLLPNGCLTAAGVHFFCPAPRTVLEFSVHDVPGGRVISPAPDLAGLSLVEQLAEVETRLDAVDTAVSDQTIGFALQPIRQIPWAAVREAVLNAIVHRDWLPDAPINLTWVQADSSLDVVSPGGFAGGVSSTSLLSDRFSRNPALADLARALGLVERQGIGIDRMFQQMLALGHRPPLIHERGGPSVRTRLVGGAPLPVLVDAMEQVRPASRRNDARVTMILHVLLREGFAATDAVAEFMQVPEAEADEALAAAADCSVGSSPLIRPFGAGLWLPGPGLMEILERYEAGAAQRRGLMHWWRPDLDQAQALVQRWLTCRPRVTSGELAAVTTFSVPAARQLLNRLVTAGVVVRGPASHGRLAHFVAAP